MQKVIGFCLFGSLLSALPAVSGVMASNNVSSSQQHHASTPVSCQISDAWCIPAAAKPKKLVLPPPPPPPPKKKPRPKRNDYVKNQLLLLYDMNKPADFAAEIIKKYHLQERSNSELGSIRKAMILATTNGQDPLDLVDAINKRQKEIAANANNLFFTAATRRRTKNDYPLVLTGIKAAHKYTKGEGVRIGMIDTPIDINHRSLRSSRVRRMELVPPGTPKNQQHGTEVAGIMVSQNPRIGIAPEAELVSVSAFQANPKNPDQRSSTGSLVAKALDIIIREKVDVLNLSFAGGKDRLVDNMVVKAIQSGIVVVASAGNNGPGARAAYPAAINNVLAVTAIDRGEKLFPRANRGKYIDLAAPGVEILTTAPRGSFSVSTGTSLATAHVTGVVALLMSVQRGFRRDLLQRTAVDLGASGHDAEFGHGLVDLNQALSELGR